MIELIPPHVPHAWIHVGPQYPDISHLSSLLDLTADPEVRKSADIPRVWDKNKIAYRMGRDVVWLFFFSQAFGLLTL